MVSKKKPAEADHRIHLGWRNESHFCAVVAGHPQFTAETTVDTIGSLADTVHTEKVQQPVWLMSKWQTRRDLSMGILKTCNQNSEAFLRKSYKEEMKHDLTSTILKTKHKQSRGYWELDMIWPQQKQTSCGKGDRSVCTHAKSCCLLTSWKDREGQQLLRKRACFTKLAKAPSWTLLRTTSPESSSTVAMIPLTPPSKQKQFGEYFPGKSLSTHLCILI